MDQSAALARSWDANAANWTRAVRGGLIPSRKAATDAAIVDTIVAAIRGRRPARLLDLGCGEGWLIRRVRARTACDAVGIDGAARLIADARAADPENRYEVLAYRDLIADPRALGTDFDVVACNYALFDEDVATLLAALRPLLAEAGVVVIQTLHPWSAAPGADYRDGWRREDFAAFESNDWQPMPWYFRTLESWLAAIAAAGLTLQSLAEPAAAAGAPPLSLLMTCCGRAAG